jgi:formylglycine-generating enzyme required for sulfatase activity
VSRALRWCVAHCARLSRFAPGFAAGTLCTAALWLACAASATAAQTGAPVAGTVLQDCPDCPAMVVVPPGEFSMGSLEFESDRIEGPIHRVRIGYSFAVGRTSVTNAQYARFVAATGRASARGCGIIGRGGFHVGADNDWRDPGYGRPPRDTEPVVCVSWLDASAYAAWLSKLTHRHYRLLSEAEWEYAARAGSTTRFHWGDDPAVSCRHANLYDRSAVPLAMPYAPAPCDDGYETVAPVASFPPNAFGLYDMIGNVWQWVEDCYVYEYPPAPVDGRPVPGYAGCPLRSIRGGSWGTRVDRLRPSWRGRDPDTRLNILFGFRVARDL